MNQNTIEYLISLNEHDAEPEELSTLYASATAQKIPVVRKTTARTLALLCRLTHPAEILEIGTGSGYSALWMRRGAPSAHITTIERDKNRYQAAERLFAGDGGIELIQGDFFRQPDEFHRRQYDFVFLDAVKRDYPEYLRYLPAMIHTGGILVTDNVTFGERIPDLPPEMEDKYRGGVDLLRRFNEELAHSPYFNTLFLPVDDGFSVSIRNDKDAV